MKLRTGEAKSADESQTVQNAKIHNRSGRLGSNPLAALAVKLHRSGEQIAWILASGAVG